MFFDNSKQKRYEREHKKRKKAFLKKHKLLNIQKDTDYTTIFGICNNLDCSLVFEVDEKRLKYLKIKEYKEALIKHNKISI